MECRLGLYHSMSTDEVKILINKLHDEYKESMSIYAEEKKEVTEMAIGDPLILMAAHLMIHLSYRHNHPNYLIEAICLLEDALISSQHAFQFKILLLRLYCRFNAGRGGIENWEGLDIKHILYDTLGYLLMDPLLHLSTNHAMGLYDQLVSFHEENNRQTPEYILKAFQNGKFSKVMLLCSFSHSYLLSVYYIYIYWIDNNI